MSLKDQLAARQASLKKNPHLHTQSHLLADELSNKLRDKRHFGYYLKMTYTHDHGILRTILGQVLESKNVTTPGRLFTYLLKQHLKTVSDNDTENNKAPKSDTEKTES